ncbi:MAG: type II toxin-antitoxin system PemK/MazF family toxin [Coriobacteriia bacterium]|nr:type II toxin-antitoxin system PemK/MazF family toxin [Coriobacteriia bacterium]
MPAYGEIVLVAGGPYSSKPRPVLILQNPRYETGNSIIVVPFTSVQNPGVSTRIQVSPSSGNGLDRSCFLEVDKLSAIDVSFIGKSIGKLEERILSETATLAQSLIALENS